MNKAAITLSIILSLVTIFIISCSDSTNSQNNSSYDFGEQITIGFGETIDINNQNLSFSLDSITEGRCPIDAVCVWQGEAIGFFTMISSSTPSDFNLSIMGLCTDDCGQIETVGGYNVELIELNPYPTVNLIVTEQEYEAIIIVTEI